MMNGEDRKTGLAARQGGGDRPILAVSAGVRIASPLTKGGYRGVRSLRGFVPRWLRGLDFCFPFLRNPPFGQRF